MKTIIKASLLVALATWSASCSPSMAPPGAPKNLPAPPRPPVSYKSTTPAARPPAVVAPREEPAPETAPLTTIPSYDANENVVVVLDKGGRLSKDRQDFPTYVQEKVHEIPVSHPYSPGEKANLYARHKTLLPLALYVPSSRASTTAKGTYYQYEGKYWYWKKPDGLFYLDEIYYK